MTADLPFFGCCQGVIVMFDYGSPAELLMAKRTSDLRQRPGYRRFATAADSHLDKLLLTLTGRGAHR
ncbi:MAG: hypothetical protein ACRECV_20455 [Xanthobacteraceae bacterium]